MTNSMRVIKEWNSEENLHTLDDYVREKYWDQIEEAKEEATYTKLLDTAKNLLTLKTPIDIIVKATGLTKKEITSLQKN